MIASHDLLHSWCHIEFPKQIDVLSLYIVVSLAFKTVVMWPSLIPIPLKKSFIGLKLSAQIVA